MRRIVAMLAYAAYGIVATVSADPIVPRTVRLVAAAPVGSGLDLTLRTLAEVLQQDLGAAVIVDNRPGGDGILAAQFVMQSAADGGTLLAASPAQMTINPVLRSALSYDPERDFTPISMLSRVPLALVSSASSRIDSMATLIRRAAADPGRIRYGSASSTFVVATEHFAEKAGIALEPIPYNGVPPVVNALLAGDVDIAWVNLPPVLGHVRAGRLRVLAVDSQARDPSLPDAPTLAEVGVPGYEFEVWVGAYAPAGTPPALVRRMHAAFASALGDPEVRKRLTSAGIVPVASTPEALLERVRSERKMIERIARTTGLAPR